MSAIALDEWESFVSRIFKKDLDTGSWFVEFMDPSANDNDLVSLDSLLSDEDEDDWDGSEDESFAAFWHSMKAKRRG